MESDKSSFSAAEPALGYLYQIRYALLQTLKLPEETTCLIEGDDDIDFTDPEEGRLLASLKHKAPGDTLTDLSPDFWKSVRIWLTYYMANEDSTCAFFLFTTGSVVADSFLTAFLPGVVWDDATPSKAKAILDSSTSKTISKTTDLLKTLSFDKWSLFFKKVTIIDQQLRIENIPQAVMDRMRTERPQFREPIYQRLEGWWIEQCVNILCKKRTTPMRGGEVSEMLSHFSDQFREDNLPIDYANAEPEDGINPDADDRLFVRQLKCVGLKSDRLRRSILDYYRAFEQRASWLRENVTLTGEVERYDDRLVDEWGRLKEIVWEDMADDSPEEALQTMGRKLLNQISTSDHVNLRIRAQVTAPYITMGSYHMLANETDPRVHWHPRFLDRVTEILEGGKA